MKYSLVFLVLFFGAFNKVNAQILYDKPSQDVVLEALEKIYNFEFNEIDPLIKQLSVKYSNHPVIPMLKAIRLQWQYLPIKDNKAVIGQYMSLLEDANSKAKLLEKNASTIPEASFFLMAGHGFIALVHNYNGDKFKAVGEAKKAYNYVMKGFELMEKNPEFYMSSGLYNYYVVEYPEEHPMIKPLLLFFKDGNRELGLKQMDIASKKGTFAKTESAYYLARINMKHEMKFGLAANYMSELVQRFPRNPFFVMKYAESLLFLGKYETARVQLDKIRANRSKILELAVHTFDGIVAEKENKNDSLAETKYIMALKIPYDDEFTKEYHAFAYCGLARISIRKGDHKKAAFYYKKAAALAEYESTQREVKNFK